MRADHDGMLVVRAELCDRLDSLQQAAAKMNVRDFAAADRRDPDDGRRLRPDPRSSASPTRFERAIRAAAARLPGRPLFRPAARRDRLRPARRGRQRGACSPRSRSASAPEGQSP